MKSEIMNKDIDIDDISFNVKVDEGVIERVLTGETKYIGITLNEHNQDQLLENVDGHLVMVTKKMPKKWYGCYLYNNGVFPYVINELLDFLILDDGEDDCFTRIIGIDAIPLTRFRTKGPDKPRMEDPKGNYCIWGLQFEVIPVPDQPKEYLMRWNPSISSFTEDDFEECVANKKNGMFRMNWSIHEWEEARRGDIFYMMRTGDEKAGIVCLGLFISDPYPADDWGGSTKRRMYVDLVCTNHLMPGDKPRTTLEKLQKAIPEFEWEKGHSGVLLSKEVAEKLDELLRNG